MLEKLPADHYGRKSRSCVDCGEFKGPDEFDIYKHKKMLCGYQVYNRCKDCEKLRKLKHHLKNTYNLSWLEYLKMVDEQEGKCYLCKETPNRLCVDHCHATGEVRKLLCWQCNTSLSKFEQNPEYLDRVKEYLKI